MADFFITNIQNHTSLGFLCLVAVFFYILYGILNHRKGAQAQEIPGRQELIDALDDVKVAQRGPVKPHLPHLKGNARRGPSLSVVGVEGVDVHVHGVVLFRKFGAGGQGLQGGDAFPGVEGGELLQQLGFHVSGEYGRVAKRSPDPGGWGTGEEGQNGG